jgi:hypothetical protein
VRSRLLLLGGQSVAVGLAVAFLVIPAGALFLTTYGAPALAWVYLAVAPTTLGASLAMSRAARHQSPGGLAATAVAVHLFVVTAGWLVLSTSSVSSPAAWVTFPLLVLSFVSAPVGIVLVRAQATRLLEPRQLKSRFTRLAAGFWVGFTLGGLVTALVVPWLGGNRHLLSLSAVGALVLLLLVSMTARRHPEELLVRPVATDAVPHRPVRLRRGRAVDPSTATSPRTSPLAHPLVRLVLLYDLLTVAVIQLLDWVVWERVAAHYGEQVEVARFLGLFAALVGAVTVVFVLLVAGWLLKRSGAGLGLAMAPLAVLWVLVATALTGAVVGVAAQLFLALACTQRVVAAAFTDGLGRASLTATYQALQPDLRVRARTLVTLVSTPAALVMIGLLLLGLQSLGLGVAEVSVLLLVLTCAWLLVAVLAHRQYGVHLRDVLAQRAWDPAVIRIDDDASRIAVLHLLTSGDPDDVRTGLDALVDAGHDVADHVLVFLGDPEPGRRRVAIETAVTADCLDKPAVLAEVCRLADDVDPEVAVTAAAAMVRLGRRQRQVGRTAWLAALSSSDPTQVDAALRAAAACPHPFFVPFLVGTASYAASTSNVLDALGAHTRHLAPAVEGLLTDRAVPRPTRERVVHFLGQAGTPRARALLRTHLDDDDTSVAHAAALCLAALGEHETAEEVDLGRRLVAVAERAHRSLQILMLLDDGEGSHPLRSALRDEVAVSAERAEALLDLVHDPRAISSAVISLGSMSADERSTALEALETTVGPTWARLVLGLLDPLLDDEARMQMLARHAPVAAHDLPEWLRELVLDQDGYWHEPWLRACALYAEVDAAPAEAAVLAAALRDDPDPDVAETARRISGLPA